MIKLPSVFKYDPSVGGILCINRMKKLSQYTILGRYMLDVTTGHDALKTCTRSVK